VSVAAIVLAAGASSRMGSPKALLDLGGESFLARIARTARAAGASAVIAVVGPPDGEQVRARLPPGVAAAWNPAPARGMLSSIQSGVAALPRGTAAALIWPVDLPEVAEATVRRILAAPAGRIAVPEQGGAGGHPVRLPARLFAELAALPVEAGLRGLLEAHPGEVERISVDDPAVRRDVDTPADLAALRKRWKA
jgi:CTP:molybdopterin cytidylyltransferase MocA